MESTTHSAPSPGDDLPRALGASAATARFRSEPGDFRVDEQIDVPEHATGAHWWLRITKTGMNTKDVVRLLAEMGSAKPRQVGYAGLKDRHAVTTQWLSLPLEHVDPESLAERLPAGLELLDWKRARHAIRRGGLRGNRFRIHLRHVDGDRDELSARLGRIKSGVPNYFGDQRFGHSGQNLARARRLFAGELTRVPRFERGLYLSAARSWLFNLVLAERVRRGDWNRLLPGEAVMLDGSRSRFRLDRDTLDDAQALAELQGRLDRFDIHPSGPLPGLGEPAAGDECLALENEVLAREPELLAGLEDWRLKAERRALRVVPGELEWDWEASGDAVNLVLSFSLPPGAFATTVLRELMVLLPPDQAPG
ncbi:tRNA pseudouridine(13) synthase TruD [Marinihelvus fidelis]|uniref:tRNA pseudouridine synthase D n=1 Tax=Marinihelvus fidelis TaxID=2613842 RepID=A0A5N0TG97_9GAMM|nr:tRNA pseudouridine(13) synthase TruD [Marinihelvus fidelis]KAA9134072.1 tRNA pseudouridine(13) synthase TruD [Marinihelvus fidelis]